MSSWHLVTLWPWWLLPPMALLLTALLLRLPRKELAELAPAPRRLLLSLRVAAGLILLALCAGPALVRDVVTTVRPWVVLALDRSGSMAVADPAEALGPLLDEAVATGLLERALRPATARAARRDLLTWLDQREAVLSALAGRDPGRPTEWSLAIVQAQTHGTALAGEPSVAGHFTQGAELFARLSRRLAGDAAVGDPSAAWTAWCNAGPAALAALDRAQATADAALVAGAEPGSPVATALATWRATSRARRGELLAQALATQLSARAEVQLLAWSLDGTAVPATAAWPEPAGLTDPGRVLSALARDWPRAKPLAAVVLLGDGRATTGGDPLPAARALVNRGGTAQVVVIGSATAPADAVVAALDAPAEAFTGEDLRLDVRLHVDEGLAKGWDLVLERNGRETARRVVTQAPGWQHERFVLQVDEPGIHAFTATLVAQAGAATATQATTANDHAEAAVAVSETPLAVLLLDSSPRWEMRLLADVLARDRRARVTARWLQGGDAGAALPADLSGFDALILGDLSPEELNDADQRRLERFVFLQGGCLVVVSGPRGMPARFGLGGLADLLPVRPTDSATAPAPSALALTPAGATHPLTAIAGDPLLNQRLWSLLPPVRIAAPGLSPVADAQVLVTAADRWHSPVLAVRDHGAGRVVWLGTDETWRWRDRLGDRVHLTFWQQVLRHGLGSRLRGADPRLLAGLDRSVVEPGEVVTIRARVRVPEAPTATPLARISPVAGGPARLVAMIAEPDGSFVARLDDLTDGRWRVVVTSDYPALSGLQEERELAVRRPATAELTDLSADPLAAGRLAAAGAGRAIAAGDLDNLAAHLLQHLAPVAQTRTTTWRAWDHPAGLLLITLLLGLEWSLRRRWGLA